MPLVCRGDPVPGSPEAKISSGFYKKNCVNTDSKVSMNSILEEEELEILVDGYISMFTSQIFVRRVLKHNHNCHFHSVASSSSSVSAHQVFQSE